MRRILAIVLLAVVAWVSGCTTVVAGDEAKRYAEGQGFEVVEVDETSVVVKIGKHCTADFILEMDGDTIIGKIYDEDKKVIRGNVSDKAIGPDQYKNDSEAAACY